MVSISPRTFRKVVVGSALYDLLMSAPYTTPWSFAVVRAQASALNQRLGGAPLPAFDAFHTLFPCLLGSLVLVWSVLRLRDPQQRFGRYDGAGRFLFATWMAWTLRRTGAPVCWLFLVPELAWGVVQWLPVAPATAAAAGALDRRR